MSPRNVERDDYYLYCLAATHFLPGRATLLLRVRSTVPANLAGQPSAPLTDPVISNTGSLQSPKDICAVLPLPVSQDTAHYHPRQAIFTYSHGIQSSNTTFSWGP